MQSFFPATTEVRAPAGVAANRHPGNRVCNASSHVMHRRSILHTPLEWWGRLVPETTYVPGVDAKTGDLTTVGLGFVQLTLVPYSVGAAAD